MHHSSGGHIEATYPATGCQDKKISCYALYVSVFALHTASLSFPLAPSLSLTLSPAWLVCSPCSCCCCCCSRLCLYFILCQQHCLITHKRQPTHTHTHRARTHTRGKHTWHTHLAHTHDTQSQQTHKHARRAKTLLSVVCVAPISFTASVRLCVSVCVSGNGCPAHMQFIFLLLPFLPPPSATLLPQP